jgi:hypothetical protein
MGNIINPTPGDLVDRQTILQVKLSHCGIEGNTGYAPVSEQLQEASTKRVLSRTLVKDKTKIDIQPILIEHEAIMQKLELDWLPRISAETEFDSLFEKLLNVNKNLWEWEDQARILRAAPPTPLLNRELVFQRKAEALDAITEGNELRAMLVKKINALWDIEVQEKMYA